MKISNPNRGPLKGGAWIEREIYLSPAWTSLSRNGHRAFMAFYDSRKIVKLKNNKSGWTGKSVCVNAKDLGVTHGHFERFGIPRGKVSAAISECMAKGFIELRHNGGGMRGDRNIYALSESWRSWKPGSKPCQERKKREKHEKKGFQGKGLGAVARWNKPRQGEQEQEAGEVLGQNNEDVNLGEVGKLEAQLGEVIKKHPQTRMAKKFWSDTILCHLKDEFQKANVYSFKNGGKPLVSLESIYKRFLNFPDDNISYIKKLYPYKPKRKKHSTQNMDLT